MDSKRIFIGMGGWDLLPFNKYFYPPKPPKGFRKLEFYSRYFDHVEINSTFYSTGLTPDHSKRWLDDVSSNPEFQFTVKLFRGYTHTFNATKDDYLSIMRILEPLQSERKLSGLVFQFPVSFSRNVERIDYLAKLSKAFRPTRLFLEVRNRSWNDAEMRQFFQDHNLHLINVDLPPLRDHIPFSSYSWNGSAYFRMMGRNALSWRKPFRIEDDGKRIVSDRYNYFYTSEELNDLAGKISRLPKEINNIFVVFHNDPEANSLINGFQLRRLVHQKLNGVLPNYFVKKFPQLEYAAEPRYDTLPLFRCS